MSFAFGCTGCDYSGGVANTQRSNILIKTWSSAYIYEISFIHYFWNEATKHVLACHMLKQEQQRIQRI